jgi:DNA-binding Lrp family transcriptional regulator
MFSTLYYEGDASGFGWDQSRADYAFFGTLAFWTGGDPERMERIGRDSAMYRGKWITHRTYIRQHTIPNAIKSCRSFYDPDFNGRAGVRRTVEVLRSGDGSVRRDNDRAIYLTLLEVAERVGQVRGSWIVFNANQEEIAGTTGIKQRTVSHRLTRMMEKGVIERTSKGVQGRNSFYRIPYLANTDVGGASATDYQGWHLANTDKHMGGESCVVEKKPRPRGAEEEKEKEDEPTPQTKTLTGPEIEAEWKAGEHHPLGCECITCSLQTPRYAKPHGEPGVGKLRKAA